MKRLEEHFALVIRCGLLLGTFCCLFLLASGLYLSEFPLYMAGAICLIPMVAADILMLLAPDLLRIQATERTLNMASVTLEKMGKGLTSETAQEVCSILLPETKAIAVSITDREHVLGYHGVHETDFPLGGPISSAETLEVIQSGRMQTFNSIRHENERALAHRYQPAGIIVPLLVQDVAVGTIKFYYAKRRHIDKTQLVTAWRIGQILSTELSATELDRQAELTAQAEVKALQAQINPHFLFNTLNTIASLTRTDPAKARDLLREFAVFYRKTLENSQSQIPLSKEIEQTHRYLIFEHARFGENRISVADDIEPGCENVIVPAFIVQPIVENAVKHAMRDEGTLHINILVATEGDDCLISVVDDGLGMDEATAQRLISGAPKIGSSRGCGVALHNVAERIEKYYGVGSGVEIMSKADEGTCVTLRLAQALSHEMYDD